MGEDPSTGGVARRHSGVPVVAAVTDVPAVTEAVEAWQSAERFADSRAAADALANDGFALIALVDAVCRTNGGAGALALSLPEISLAVALVLERADELAVRGAAPQAADTDRADAGVARVRLVIAALHYLVSEQERLDLEAGTATAAGDPDTMSKPEPEPHEPAQVVEPVYPGVLRHAVLQASGELAAYQRIAAAASVPAEPDPAVPPSDSPS